MGLRINRKLLPVKCHYFFFYAGLATMMPFLPVYARQLGITEAGLGIIYLLMPVLAAVLRPAIGWLADATRQHKAVFLTTLLVTIAGYLSLAFIPPYTHQSSTAEPLALEVGLSCPAIGTDTLSQLSFCDKCAAARVYSKFQDMIATNSSLSPCNASCHPTELFFANNLTSVFQVDLLSGQLRDHCVYWSVTGSSVTPPAICSSTAISCRLRCSNDSDSLLQQMGAVPGGGKQQERVAYHSALHFWLFLVLMLPSWVGSLLSVPLADAIAYKLLDDSSRYGLQRLWGSLGWGLLSFLGGILIDNESLNSKEKNFLPAFYLLTAILIVDVLVCTQLQLSELIETKPRFWCGISQLVRQPKVLLFISSCCIIGVLSGVLWTYAIIFLQDLAKQWDCSTSDWNSVMSGLTLFIQCFFSELPFFFMSAWIIKKLGPVYTQALVLLTFGIRFFLYSIISNPWLILPVKMCNGITFGLFCANMVVYAGDISPPGMMATIQGLVGAIFECCGVAVGSGIGGVVYYKMGGAKMFQIFSGVAMVTCLVYLCLHHLDMWITSGNNRTITPITPTGQISETDKQILNKSREEQSEKQE